LADSVELPILSELASGVFRFGSVTVVEFDAESPWYETSMTIAAKSVIQGVPTDYHTFEHAPDDVRAYLARLGVDVQKAEESGRLRILNSYSSQVGLAPETKASSRVASTIEGSLEVDEWTKLIGSAAPDDADEKRRIHVDDNTSAMLRINDEKTMSNFWLTASAFAKKHGLVMVNSLIAGISSEAFYKRLESVADTIIDLETVRKERVRHRMRVRRDRGTNHDSSWKGIEIADNGEVSVVSGARALLWSEGFY